MFRSYVLVLQRVIELVCVGHALARAEACLIGDDEERLRLGVVDADDLVAQQVQLDLDKVVGWLDQAEQHVLFLVGFALARQIVALELAGQVGVETGMVEQLQIRLGQRLEAADLGDLILDRAQRGCIGRCSADRRGALRARWRGQEQ